MNLRQPIGSTLDGKYEVLDHLGGGGMGEVYLVHHVHLEEKRVVKILRPDRMGDQDAQKRFLREARFATKIQHPNVAILFDYSRLEDGGFYMVWEHIEGEEIGERLERAGPFPLREAVQLGIQALRGLEAIHGAGMIHRDISPDNLMLTEDSRGRPRLKIIDLGLAKNLEPDPNYEVTQDGVFMGKLLYCAPEQAGVVKGETLDHRTDLYSFSLVLYEMVTGRRPFEAGNPQGAIFKRLSEEPLSMVGRNPDVEVPPALDEVVRKGLARERDDRYSSAIEYLDALDDLTGRLAGVSTQAIERPPELAALVAGTSPGPSRTELSTTEKEDLLAQIERAADRVREISQAKDRVEALVGDGRLDEARQAIARLEDDDPRSRVLPGLRDLVAQAERKMAGQAESGEDDLRQEREIRAQRQAERAAAMDQARAAIDSGHLDEARLALGRAEELSAADSDLAPLRRRLGQLERAGRERARVTEAEEMVKKYLKAKQLPLARLALDTLEEIAPHHPSLPEMADWVDLLAEELEQDRAAADLLADGREALAAGDVRGARRQLARLEKADSDLADVLRREIDRETSDQELTSTLVLHRERFDELLAEGKIDKAQGEIEQMSKLGVARLTLDLFRSRLDEAKVSAREVAQAEVYLEAFRERIDRGDFSGAREVAGEFQRAVSESSRPGEMLAEVSELEAAAQRRRSIEQGTEQVEAFIAEGDAQRAELALKVLLQMDPGHKKRKSFERRIAKLSR